MIKILETKLASQKDKNMLIWKNIDDNIYNKYNQYFTDINNKINIDDVINSRTELLITPENLKNNNIPTLTDDNKKTELYDIKNEIITIPDIKSTNTELKNIPKVLNVIPVKISANIPKVLTSKQNQEVIKKSKKPNLINIILEESLTCDIYKNDVKEKLISFVSSNEFSKVFGITKSAEIMSGIVNERINKSVALFISFLFDKCVLYNEKEFIYDKNKEYIGKIII